MSIFSNPYFKLGVAALLPAVFTAVFAFLEKKTAFGKIKNVYKQIIIGVFFGGLAVLGTEFGIPIPGAQVNCRDAAVLCAGVFFGGPAGIIAGFIGGIERWIAVAWGIGSFTRLACSVSTIAAGFIAAAFRKWFFEGRRPGLILAFALGIFTEIFHMTMVFLTNTDELEKAIDVIDACMVPMVLASGLSLLIACILQAFAIGENPINKSLREVKIADAIQRVLLIVIVIAFFLSSAFISRLQSETSIDQIEKSLRLATEDVELDIADAVEEAVSEYEAEYNVSVEKDSKEFKRLVYLNVMGATENRHVGENGFVLIFDEVKSLVSRPVFIASGNFSYLNTLGNYGENLPEEGTVFEMTLMGTKYYARIHTVEGYTILSMMDAKEANLSKASSTYASKFMEVLIFGVLFVLIYILFKNLVIESLENVTDSLKKIAAGDLNEVVEVNNSEEFAILSEDINSTVDTLKRYIDEAAARIDADLAMAKDIQESVLPNVFPAFPNRKEFDIYARMDTAKEVGGDFYDFYITKDNFINLIIADVSGKGIPAAMFMMRSKTQLQSLTRSGKPINEVYTLGNKDLCTGNDAGMFVTAWQGGVNLETGLVEFVNAGHNPPLVKHKDGKFEYIKSKVNLVLGGMDGMKYTKQEMRLAPGDTLFLYTDGVTEATDIQSQLYGEERLQRMLNSKEFVDMKDLCDSVKADVDKFVGDAPQFDDITMLAFKYVGFEDKELILTEKKAIVVPAKTEKLDGLMKFVDANLAVLECPQKAKTQIDIAVDEIFANIRNYAYPSGEGDFLIEMYPCKEKLGVCLKFIDTGIEYNPLLHEDPDITLSADERKIGGLGILMVKKTMSKVEYEYKEGKNILTLTKFFVD